MQFNHVFVLVANQPHNVSITLFMLFYLIWHRFHCYLALNLVAHLASDIDQQKHRKIQKNKKGDDTHERKKNTKKQTNKQMWIIKVDYKNYLQAHFLFHSLARFLRLRYATLCFALLDERWKVNSKCNGLLLKVKSGFRKLGRFISFAFFIFFVLLSSVVIHFSLHICTASIKAKSIR